jgi:negative regulator of flagellin synthesis FlgM
MTELNPITPSLRVGPTSGTAGRSAHQSESPAVRRGQDRVEVSELATYMSKLKQLPVRQDLIDSVRARIADGTYDTPERLEAAIDELIQDL